ncbi:hypothetical protein Cgig2_026316 [Carnegiea gigantea]|uniref:Uncharacterized protein n=1 Tax=Carnegiea gigantea TaxID=171969 RepID=A0A9Q1KDH8_9CARY|nr:hypothetical protein Cgig2_026316 [Carnegiea gigantea]
MSTRGRTGSSSSTKEDHLEVDSQDFSSHYKQALLNNTIGDGLEGQKSAKEVVEEDVHEVPSDNTKTISQSLNNAHNRPIYIGKPSCGSSMEDDEEIDNSLCPFDDPLEMKLQLHEKNERCKLSSKGKKRGNKNPKAAQHSPTPTKIAKEALNVRKSLGVYVISDEIVAIRRITRNLRTKLDNKSRPESSSFVEAQNSKL